MELTPPISRRRLIKAFTVLTASATMPATRWMRTVLAGVQASTPSDIGLLRLRLSDFPVLQKELGSVRLGTSRIGSDHHPVGLFYPVLINRGTNGQFYALDTECTHEGCTVPTYDPSAQCMQCPCHGSQYLIDGTVRHGPANFPLRSFTVRYDGADQLTVELPDISFGLDVLQVQPATGRLRLRFVAFDQLVYEIYSRPSLQADWSGPIPFAVTPDGPVDRVSLVGQADYAEVYLDRRISSAGFYAVAVRTNPD
jgi:Rieske Fe-S protein